VLCDLINNYRAIYSLSFNQVQFGNVGGVCVISCVPAAIDREETVQTLQVANAVDNSYDCVADEELYPSSEEVVSAIRQKIQLNPTSVILENFSSRNLEDTAENLQHYIATAENYWSCIRAEMTASVDIAASVCEQLARVQAYISALKCKPKLASVPDHREPANKKATKQRYFVSTKKSQRSVRQKQHYPNRMTMRKLFCSNLLVAW